MEALPRHGRVSNACCMLIAAVATAPLQRCARKRSAARALSGMAHGAWGAQQRAAGLYPSSPTRAGKMQLLNDLDYAKLI